MKKQILAFSSMVAGAIMFTGCNMCSDPIDFSCKEQSHISDKQLSPDCITYEAPKIVPTKDVFRPVFRAGTERLCAIGSGNSLEESTSDAIINFKKETKCDYVVAVSREIVKRTHPTWRFFATTNYQVTIYGIPVYLDKLVREEVQPEKTQGTVAPQLTKEEVVMIIKQENTKNQTGLIKLSDINVQIQAKGQTTDKAGVVFPIK